MKTLDDYSIQGDSNISEKAVELLNKSNKLLRISVIAGYILAGLIFSFSILCYTNIPFYGRTRLIFMLLPFSSAFIIIPILLLQQYTKNISRYIETNSVGEFEIALNRYKQFWRFCGILIICLFVFIGFLFLYVF